ncbi:MAG: tetratricopeptide repeat protein, partial [Myxococcota bacterium]
VEDALASFEAALAIQPASDDALRAAAEAHWALGDERGASDRLERLVRRAPDDVGARVSLAVILRAQERWDDALEQAREVLVRAPESATALLVVARIYRARDAYDVAKLVLQKALALVPEDEAMLRAEVYDEQGLLELARGDTQAAFEAFGQAITADASFAPAHMNMGSVLLNAGDFSGARAQYEAVLDADAGNLEAKVALAIARRGEGDHRVARRLYREVLQEDPAHPDALLDYAILRADFLDEREASVETFEAFLAAAPRRHPGRAVAERYLAEIRAFADAPEPPDDESWVEENGDPAEEEWVDEGDESWDDAGGDEEWEDLE